MVDVVNGTDAVLQPQQVTDDFLKILARKSSLLEWRIQPQLDVKFQPAHLRKIVLSRIEKHSMEQSRCRLYRRWIPWTLLSVDLDKCVIGIVHGILRESHGESRSDLVAFGKEHVKGFATGFNEVVDDRAGNFLIGFDQDFARFWIDHVSNRIGSLQIVDAALYLFAFGFQKLTECRFRDLLPGRDKLGPFLPRVRDVLGELGSDQILIQLPVKRFLINNDAGDGIKGANDIFIRIQSQGPQEGRR